MTRATQRHNSKRTLQVVSQISTIAVLQIHIQYTAPSVIFSGVIPNRQSPVRAPVRNAPLIQFLILALYTTVCLFILYASFFLHLLLTYLCLQCFDAVGWAAGRPVKNWVMRCWRGYLSGARCRLAYDPADATATHCLLLQWNPDWFYLSGTGSPG